MRALARGLQRVESLLGQQDAPTSVIRVVVGALGREVNLKESVCLWTLCSNGCMVESVRLDGDASLLTKAELDRFILSFPIRRYSGGAAAASNAHR